MFRSLSTRLFAVLAVGLVAVQAVSFAAFLAFRGNESRQQMLHFMAADVAFVHDFLGSLPAGRRAEWLPRLNRGYYAFSLRDEAVPAESTPGLEKDRRIAPTLAGLRARLPPDTPIRVLSADPAEGGGAVRLLLPLDARATLVLHLTDPFALPGAGTLVAYLLLILLAVAPFAWLGVRMATRRIGHMLDTVERFGRNLRSPPAPEQGPSELVRAAVAFNRMRERILRQLDERTQILAAISHDLQTPLTRLRLRCETISDAAQRDALIGDIEHMGGLIREGLDYARSAHLNEAHSPIEVNQWLEGMVDAATDSGGRCTLSGRACAPYRGALRALTRALQNLIDNALKFGGEARIEIDDSPQRLCIRIADPGPGLADELLEKVFDPFVRAESSRNRDTGGTGLGLSIARNLVRAHGGDILLANRAPGGLVATVVLPRDDPATAAGTPVATP